MKRMLTVGLALLMTLFCAAAWADGSDNWLAGVLGTAASDGDKYVALLQIQGEISESDYLYDHLGTLDAISDLIDDEDNRALVLYINTPGGNMYESDELYHALTVYKQKTGRPIYGYMAQECCSGGVLIAMAADELYASRMTITGNVGVYITSTSEAGLYEKLGVEMEYIATGKNKVSGYPSLTDEQRTIYQAMIDESFDFFKEAIASARGLSEEQMQPFEDGRLLSALQAKELGLIDGVMYYDELMDKLSAAYPEDTLKDITPDGSYMSGDGESYMKWMNEIEKWLDDGKDAKSGKNVLRGI